MKTEMFAILHDGAGERFPIRVKIAYDKGNPLVVRFTFMEYTETTTWYIDRNMIYKTIYLNKRHGYGDVTIIPLSQHVELRLRGMSLDGFIEVSFHFPRASLMEFIRETYKQVSDEQASEIATEAIMKELQLS